MKHQIFILDF